VLCAKVLCARIEECCSDAIINQAGVAISCKKRKDVKSTLFVVKMLVVCC